MLIIKYFLFKEWIKGRNKRVCDYSLNVDYVEK